MSRLKELKRGSLRGSDDNEELEWISLENFGMFFILLLPLTLLRFLSYISEKWGALVGAMISEVVVMSHIGECITIALLLIGTSTIARFIISEYRLVKQKAEAMLAYQTGDRKQGKREVFSNMEMFEYRMDYYFSTSKWAKVALLLSATFVQIAVGAGLLVVFMEDHSISNAVWIAWTYVADPGTHADCPNTFLIRLISLFVTLGGMLIFALMISIISDSIGEKGESYAVGGVVPL